MSDGYDLGNTATVEPPATQDRDSDRSERLRIRHIIRRAIRSALGGCQHHQSLVDCGNPVPGESVTRWERDNNGRVRLANIVRCGSKQLCVFCAGRLRAVEAMLIAWRVACHFARGGGVSMMTVAPRHHSGEALEPNKVCLIECFNAAWKTKAMRQIREAYGIVGTAKVFEITHGENGWHPHLHVLLFHRRFIDITEAEERLLVVTFHREFNKQLAKWANKVCQHPKAAKAGLRWTPEFRHGRPTGKRKVDYTPLTNAQWYELDPSQVRDADLAHGINFVPITPDGTAGDKIAAYVGKIQLEMTRSDLKTGKTDGSRSLFQIMHDYGTTKDPADAALIREAADVLKGVQLVVWTGQFHGAEPLYGNPSEDFEAEALATYCAEQDLEPPDGEHETIGGMAPDVHRAADRASTSSGDPLLWRALLILEAERSVDDVAELFNGALPQVVVDRAGEHAYPIIRFAEPPVVDIDASRTDIEDDLAAVRVSIRRLGKELQAERIARVRRAGERRRKLAEESDSGS